MGLELVVGVESEAPEDDGLLDAEKVKDELFTDEMFNDEPPNEEGNKEDDAVDAVDGYLRGE